MTTGVVSATERRMEQSEFAYHQTDALANYGNLGGPIIGLDGAVVGLMTMLGPNPDWPWLINSGVALFVDSATIAQVLPQLERGENQEAPRTLGLGVSMQWNRDGKALEVKRLVEGAGADRAGIKVGDQLLTVDGQGVEDVDAVKRLLVRHHAGDQVLLRLRRDGVELALTVELTVFQ